MEFKKLGRTREKIPVLGMGTWKIGGGWFLSDYSKDEENIEAMKFGLRLGMKFIDTAEGYGEGHAEELVGKAVEGKAFIASKVSPENFHYDDVMKSCNSSLERIGIKQIDLYQLHWPNPKIPIRETMRAMERLVDDGKIRHIGLSNFSVKQTREAQEALSKYGIVSNQVEYSLLVREVEKDILPFCKKERITLIAYSPFGQGKLFGKLPEDFSSILSELSKKYEKTISQIALNWLISKEPVVAIPKASNILHMKENLGAIDWKMKEKDVKLLEEVSGKNQKSPLRKTLKSRIKNIITQVM